jgi:sec-independent protein translocase protein TatC
MSESINIYSKDSGLSNDEGRMTFTEHLAELRVRIIRAGIAVIVGFIVCYIFSNQIFFLIARPLRPQQGAAVMESGQGGSMQAPAPAAPDTAAPTGPPPAIWVTQNPAEAFWVKLKLSAYAGIIVTLPFVVYQLCAFVFPGLKPRERKMVRFLLAGCAGFAVFGVLVAYFGVFPFFLPYLVQWVPEGVQQQFRMNETVSLILMFLLGFAVSFQFPMAVLVLVYLGLLSPATLKRYRRIAIVVMSIVAAVLTPPDPISMMMMLTPMLILYEASIWMSYMVVRRRRQEAASPGSGRSG